MSANVLLTQEKLNIALCPPAWEPMQQALIGGAADATYIIQKGIAEGLQTCGHTLTFVAPSGLNEVQVVRLQDAF